MEEQDATDETQPLDYIFSVEILNEGVDIVEVNQVIMLRPTESPIVFIQQLGRGLRKAEGKEYVVKTEIKVGDLIDTIEYDYPTFHLSMDCFWAEIVSGDLVLTEHEASRWLTKAELDSVECLQSVRN
ncbi:MAG: hypothetical protein E7262_03090 [Lachnospiraceae bacterium]|nr:hypothetical protein [Lachnospiraceae bacterium]